MNRRVNCTIALIFWILALICVIEGLYMGFHTLSRWGVYDGFRFAAFVWTAGMFPSVIFGSMFTLIALTERR